MKRIIGVKTGPRATQNGPTSTVNSKLTKSKKEASPEPDIAEKKEAKKSRWTYSGTHGTQLVGLSVRRETARDATSKERATYLNSTKMARTDRQKKSPKRLTQPPSWDQGRPLWGVKPDYSQAVRKDRSTSQTHRMGRTNTSLNTSTNMIAERLNKPGRSIEIRKEVDGGNHKSRYTTGVEATSSVQVQVQVNSTVQNQNAAASGNETGRIERGHSKSHLKSALKKFPKIFHSAVLPDNEPVFQDYFVPVERVIDHLLPVPVISQEVSACHSKRAGLDRQELHLEADLMKEFVESARHGEAMESMPALVTDPEDVEAIRKLSNFNKDNPNSNYFIEFNERELKARESEKYGGIKKVMTPQMRSKRLSKRKSSMIDDREPEQHTNKERRSSSSSGRSVHRRQELHGFST